jgi:hypothetical protein
MMPLRYIYLTRVKAELEHISLETAVPQCCLASAAVHNNQPVYQIGDRQAHHPASIRHKSADGRLATRSYFHAVRDHHKL